MSLNGITNKIGLYLLVNWWLRFYTMALVVKHHCLGYERGILHQLIEEWQQVDSHSLNLAISVLELSHLSGSDYDGKSLYNCLKATNM